MKTIDYNLIDKCLEASSLCIPLITNEQEYDLDLDLDLDLINKWILCIQHELSFHSDAVQCFVIEHLITHNLKSYSNEDKQSVRDYARSLGIMTRVIEKSNIQYEDVKPTSKFGEHIHKQD